MTWFFVIAVVLCVLVVGAAVWSKRQPPPNPEDERRNEERAAEARELRERTTRNARRLARARTDNHFAERLRSAYEEGAR